MRRIIRILFWTACLIIAEWIIALAWIIETV